MLCCGMLSPNVANQGDQTTWSRVLTMIGRLQCMGTTAPPCHVMKTGELSSYNPCPASKVLVAPLWVVLAPCFVSPGALPQDRHPQQAWCAL